MSAAIGSICSGYGGLDMALEDFFDAETAWFAEFDPAPSKVLAHHWPTVPNLGDITAVDWASVEPVDIIAGGTPCQDLSAAGRRKGMTEGTRSNLWVQMREAIAVIRPSIVVWENVRGAFSAYATSEVESESGLLGVYGLDRPALRALGRVLGDLSDLGYDAEWVGVRASDAGAPHGRFRVFVLAYAQGQGFTGGRIRGRQAANGDVFDQQLDHASSDDADVAADADHGHRLGRERQARRGTERRVITAGSSHDPIAYSNGERGAESGHRTGISAQGRGRASSVPDERRSGFGTSGKAAANADDAGRGEHGGPVAVQPEHPTVEYGGAAAPDSRSSRAGIHEACSGSRGEHPSARFPTLVRPGDRSGDAERSELGRRLVVWGPYGSAIERWERVTGRVAPAPTNPDGKNGAHRLSAAFVEWMMGLPEGWVTAPAIGLTRNQQLKALGNGVVPAQAQLALSILWHRMTQAVAS